MFEVILNSRQLIPQMLIVVLMAVALPTAGFTQDTEANNLNEQYGIAAGHYERQEYSLAAEKFRKLIDDSPSTRIAATSHFFLGESLVQLADFRGAYPAYQIFLKRMPGDRNVKLAQFRMAECAFRLNWETQAANQLEKFLQKHPNDSLADYALTYLGELRLKRNEPQLAIHVLDRALRVYPNSQFALQNRVGIARALQDLGRNDEARRFYELLVSDPSNPFYGQANLQLGKIAFSEARLSDAQDYLQKAATYLDGNSSKSEAKLWVARIEMALNQFDSAFQNLSAATELADQDDMKSVILFDGAVAASKSGKLAVALDWIQKIQNTWPGSEWADDALQLGIELFYQQKRYEDAIGSIDKFVEQFENHENVQVVLEYRGRIQYDQKQYQAAYDTFDNLLQKYAKQAQQTDQVDKWLYMMGLSQIGLKQFESAAESFAIVDLHEKPRDFVASVLLAQASCSVGMEMPERAVEYLQQYLATNPTGTSAERARSDLAIAYAQAGKWELSEQSLNAFQSTASTEKAYLDTRLLVAELALKEKRFDFAERLFEELTHSANPRAHVVRGLSGVAWVRMTRGDETSSVAVFERLVKEHGESAYAAEAAMVCGKHFEQQNEYAKAIEMYRHVATRFKQTKFAAMARLRQAYSLYRQGGQANILSAESILLSYQNNEKLYLDEAAYQLAWIYHDTNRDDKAIDLFAQIVDQHVDSKYWDDAAYRTAQHAINENDFDKVKFLADKLGSREVSKEIKERVEFLNGQIAVHKKDWIAVQTAMTSVLQRSDEEKLRKKTRYWLAESLYHQELYDDAAQNLERLIANPDLVDQKRLAWVHLRRAQCFGHAEAWSDALEVSLKAKKTFSNFEALYEFDFVIGRAHAAQGRLTEARNSYQAVVDSQAGKNTKTAAMAQWRIGETYFHQENYESAIDAFRRVDSLYAFEKWRAAALVEAAKCQEHLGNWEHAAKLYKQLIEKFPDSEFRKVAENRLNLATREARNDENKTRK